MLNAVLVQFLQTYCSEKPPLLLGLSGGPDSMALLHVLLEAGYPFEVAHIDHGWRKESGEESAFLAQMCHEKKIPFHLKRLISPEEEKNLEERGRKARFDFFKALLSTQNLKGVLLAHQADDHAETVLKRLFEGASLPKLKGLLPKTEVEGMTLYRPFLKVKKKEILKWLEEKKIPYFVDPTNADPRFLRSRLRGELIPALTNHFGKEITSNLCRLGESAAELGEFLEEALSPYRQKIQMNGEEISLDFTPSPPASLFLCKCIIRDFFEQQKLVLPNTLLETILNFLKRGNCHKSLKLGKTTVKIQRKKLIISPPLLR